MFLARNSAIALAACALAACATPVVTPPDADGMVGAPISSVRPLDDIQVAILDASRGARDRYPAGESFPVSQLFCLEEDEFLVVTAQGLERTLTGPTCQYVDVLSEEEVDRRNARIVGPRMVGGSMSAEEAAARARESEKAAMRAREREEASRKKMAVRRPLPPPPPPKQMFVLRGSPAALAWYPLGTRVRVDGRVCLPPFSGSVTFQREEGGLVTVEGGTCRAKQEDVRVDGQGPGGGDGP